MKQLNILVNFKKENINNIRIVDIARMAGVSVGTVDRVIHNRGKVSQKNKEKIEAVLQQVNYQPNLIARSLASKKQRNVLAIIPSFSKGQYWEAIANGINEAAAEMKQYNVNVTKLFFDQYNQKSFDKIINNINIDETDGVLLATLFTNSVISLSKKLDERLIPYLYVDSNIEKQNQLSYFGTDSFASGIVAAKLLTEKINNDADILVARIIYKGDNDSNQVRNRRDGFISFLGQCNFKGNTHQVELQMDNEKHNTIVLHNVLKQHPSIKGCVIFNSTCYIIGEYLQKNNILNINLVGYDLIPDNTRLLSEGVITALIAQRPESQGYNSTKSICNYLISGVVPPKINLMPIDILIKENIQYYKEYLI